MLKWATERFKPEGKFNARVLYTNEDEGTIAAGWRRISGILSSALSLDRTRIYYQLFITCENGKCDIEMTHVSVIGMMKLVTEEKNTVQRNGL